MIHVMDSSPNNRGADETGARDRKSLLFFFVLETSDRNTHWRSARSGGSVSMATSQLGNHRKSKREGDIKGMNDEERKRGREGRERSETGGEDKEEEERWKYVGCEARMDHFLFYLLTVWVTLRQ